MNEKLIKDYWYATQAWGFDDGATIEDIRVAGEWVIFTERSSCGYYRDEHIVSLLDVISWVYSKVLAKDEGATK